ncbi:hypothetical protein DUNSADRAFT_8569 [Dunaliella salina]|uniref:Uncharacterized protein n=1 Tax=Dunaliella salina TaxID=3046 RepID=A0ABQ7GJ65_DUNSA|nr:hypothetical protein DUNSADRAFT_8569 [Dunaliella salina]|eukprot:KAF5834645.1 hypothetical protein DUNSADRAFT_8569 [Dunaliella salina]
MLSCSVASTPCLIGKKPVLVGTVRCSSNRSNQFTTSIEELERQLGVNHSGAGSRAQAAAHGAQETLKHSRTTPTSLVPPLRRPAAPPLELQEAHAEKVSVARSASPIQLAQLAQQLRMRVRAVQDLVDRCPQLLALSAWQLDAAVMRLASELGISHARTLFMVSKDPHLLFMGRTGAPLQEGCRCEGSSGMSTTDLDCSTDSSNSSNSSGTSSKSSSSSRSSSKSRHESQLNCSTHSHLWVETMRSGMEPLSNTGSKRPVGGIQTSNSSAHGMHAPNASPAARAATLAQALGVTQEEVVRLAASAPSVLSRPPGPLAERFRRLGEVLEGVPMARVLRMAAEEPSYLSYRPPSIDRRIQAMRLLFRKPRHKIVHMLTRQPDLVFMSPRILHNKLKVLQRIFNKEPRLVIPIIMRTPKLLRTDMDKVRECYELLEGLMGLPSRSYTFAMVCHAPAMLLEGKTRLVGRFRCISHATRGAPHWAKQWRKLYPAQRADCMLVTPVTYSRLEFLLATGQARSMHMYDALMMARSDFSQLFPTFRPIPIRRPAAAPHVARPASPSVVPHAAPTRPINFSATSVAPAVGTPHASALHAAHAQPASPAPAPRAAPTSPANISATSVASTSGTPRTPQQQAHNPRASAASTHPSAPQHAAHTLTTSAASTPDLPQGSQQTLSLSGSPPSHTHASMPGIAPFISGAPAPLPHFGSPAAAVPPAVPVVAGGAAAVALSAAAAAAASNETGVGSALPPPPPPWTPDSAPSYASSMHTPVLPTTAPSPMPINRTTRPANGAGNGTSSQAPKQSHQQQLHLQQQQHQQLNHPQHAQQASPFQDSRQPHHHHIYHRHSAQQQHHHHTHHPHSAQHQQQHHQHQQHHFHHHHNGRVLSQLPGMQLSSGQQGHLEAQHGSGIKLIGHRGSRRMRHDMMQQQQQRQQRATSPQHAQTETQHTDPSAHLPPPQHPVLVASQPRLAADGGEEDLEGAKGSDEAAEGAACGVLASSHTIHASDLLPPASAHASPQAVATTPHTPSKSPSQVPSRTATHAASHSALPTAKQATARLATQLPESEVATVCRRRSHLHVPTNGTAVHAHQGEVIQGLMGHWRNPRPLQPALEFSAVAYAVRHQLQVQGRLEPQHAYLGGGKDVHEVSQWERQRAGSSWGSKASTEHKGGSDSCSNSSSSRDSRDSWCFESTEQENSSSSSSGWGAESKEQGSSTSSCSSNSGSSRDGWCNESTEQGSSTSSPSSSSSSVESGGSDGNGVRHCQESSLQLTGKRDGKRLQGSRQQGRKASVSCPPGAAESEGVLGNNHHSAHHNSRPQHAASLPLAAAQH